MNQIPQLKNLKDKTSYVHWIKWSIYQTVLDEFNYTLEEEDIDISVPESEEFGDYSTNVALKLASILKKSPREVAQTIITSESEFLDGPGVSKLEVAGPGFINIFLDDEHYYLSLLEILNLKDKYGAWDLSNENVMVEFGQPNTHKAVTIGHLKSGVTGLSISRIVHNLGFNVVAANYFSDIGMHVAKCTWGYLKKGEPEGFDKLDSYGKMHYIAECYVYGNKMFKEDEAAQEEIKEYNKKIYEKSDDQIYTTYLQLASWSLEHQEEFFKKLGIIFDRQYPESEVAFEAIDIVKKYIGKVFKEDEGAIIFPGKDYSLNNWVFLTNQGLPTYSGKDLGLAYKKFQEFSDLCFSIVTTSVEQNDYFKAVIKALELIDEKFVGKYFHLGYGWLLQNKKKTSSRMGNTVKAIDVMSEAKTYSLAKISESKTYSEKDSHNIAEKVGMAGLKFLILSHELHTDINYDPAAFTNPEGFSGPYVLYGYVRAMSILRQQQPEWKVKTKIPEHNQAELKLLKLLSRYPQVTLDAGKTLSPHKIANYLFELTQTFNQFYKENKVLVEDEDVKNFRLRLTQAVSIVLKNGLYLLGIETVEQM